jgi:hypothetical protein
MCMNRFIRHDEEKTSLLNTQSSSDEILIPDKLLKTEDIKFSKCYTCFVDFARVTADDPCPSDRL